MAAGVEPVTSTPSRKMRPPEGGASPMTALSRLVLPAPLAPTRATVSPWRHRQVDAEQGLGRAVVHGEVLDAE